MLDDYYETMTGIAIWSHNPIYQSDGDLVYNDHIIHRDMYTWENTSRISYRYFIFDSPLCYDHEETVRQRTNGRRTAMGYKDLILLLQDIDNDTIQWGIMNKKDFP